MIIVASSTCTCGASYWCFLLGHVTALQARTVSAATHNGPIYLSELGKKKENQWTMWEWNHTSLQRISPPMHPHIHPLSGLCRVAGGWTLFQLTLGTRGSTPRTDHHRAVTVYITHPGYMQFYLSSFGWLKFSSHFPLRISSISTHFAQSTQYAFAQLRC